MLTPPKDVCRRRGSFFAKPSKQRGANTSDCSIPFAVRILNVVLDAADLAVLWTEPTGKYPVTNAWTPDRRYAIVTHGQDVFAQIVDARTFKEVKRVNIGEGGANIGFSRDGKTAFIALTGADAVAVMDVDKLTLTSQIKAGKQPQGLIVR